jgi:hypothetical protein
MESGAAAQLLREDGAGFFPSRMRDPAERAGSVGTCDYARASYALRGAASMTGNGIG